MGIDQHDRSARFSSLDPRAKILGVFAFVVAVALLTVPALVYASLVVAVGLVIWSGVPKVQIARAYVLALPLILMASLSIFLFSGPERGLVMLARTSACVVALLVLASGTEAFDLFFGLRRLKVPAVITSLLLLTQRYILVLSEELDRMSTARKARGFSGGSSLLDRYAIGIISKTAGMLLVRSAGRADLIFEGLSMRGFHKDMTPWKSANMAAFDAIFMVSIWAIAGVMIGLQLVAA